MPSAVERMAPILGRSALAASCQAASESKGLQQKSDPEELEKIIDKILSDNKDKAEQYKSGKDKLFGFFVGQVMKESGGKANPQLVNEILKKKLK